MDPSTFICKPRYSFDKEIQEPMWPKASPKGVALSLKDTLKVDLREISMEEALGRRLGDQDLIRLREEMEKIDPALLSESKSLAKNCDFGKSIFTTKESVKLANISWVFELEGPRRSSVDPIYEDDGYGFTFCDLCGGPGGFTEYLLWRHANVNGFGMTLESPEDLTNENNWNRKIVCFGGRFTIITGPQNGDINAGVSELTRVAVETGQIGLLLGDGIVGGLYSQNLREVVNTRLIVTEILLSLNLVRSGGHFVLKIFDTNTKIMSDLIYLLTFAYTEVYIFKPSSSDPFDSERYLVCKNRYSSQIDTTYISELLQVVKDKLDQGLYVDSILTNISDEYLIWLGEHNTISNEMQKEYINKLFLSIADKYKPEHHDPDSYLILWGLPSEMNLAVPVKKKVIKEEVKQPKVKAEQVEVKEKKFPLMPSLPKGDIKYTRSINGKTLFRIYIAFLRDQIVGTTDREEKNRKLHYMRYYCMELCMGRENTMRVEEKLNKIWKHSDEGDFIEFTYGSLKVRYVKKRIYDLLDKVNGQWIHIYDLVERYFPFDHNGITPSSSYGGIEGFSSPLTNIGGNIAYCSFFREDSIFGSRGLFFDIFTTPSIFQSKSAKAPKKLIWWQIYCPPSLFIQQRLLSVLKEASKDYMIHIFIPATSQILSSYITRNWNGVHHEMSLTNYTTGKEIKPEYEIIYGHRKI